jgi:hypothetical protein
MYGTPLRVLAMVVLTGCAGTVPMMPGPTSMLGATPRAWQQPAEGQPTQPIAAKPRSKPARAREVRPSATFRDQVLAAGQYYLDNTPFRDDCSGYVCAVYAKVGLPIDGSVRQLWERAEQAGAIHHRTTPNPGDIVFFDNTYDANHNRRNDDPLSHIALVLEVFDDGTILMAHGGSSQGRTTLVMNLKEPAVHRRDDGREVNDYLRRATRRDKKGTKYLASELWRAFATVKPEAIEAWLAS